MKLLALLSIVGGLFYVVLAVVEVVSPLTAPLGVLAWVLGAVLFAEQLERDLQHSRPLDEDDHRAG